MERESNHDLDEYHNDEYFNPDILPPEIKKRYHRYDRLALISALPVLEGFIVGGVEFDNDRVISTLGFVALVSGAYSFISFVRRRDAIIKEFTLEQTNMGFDKSPKGRYTKIFEAEK